MNNPLVALAIGMAVVCGVFETGAAVLATATLTGGLANGAPGFPLRYILQPFGNQQRLGKVQASPMIHAW